MQPPSMGVRLAQVAHITQLSPHFTRVIFEGPDLLDAGCLHPICDQRIKLLFGSEAALQQLRGAADPLQAWRAIPTAQRPAMRTYSLRSWHDTPSPQCAVDFVVHSPEHAGPAARWLHQAQPGDEIGLLLPLRNQTPLGVEFLPDAATEVTLIGDETALPAIARILEDRAAFPAIQRWQVALEVPSTADCIITDTRDVTIQWATRDEGPVGSALFDALQIPIHIRASLLQSRRRTCEPSEAAPLVWETAQFSSSGKSLSPEPTSPTHDAYYWIAGESSMVKALRRYFVGYCNIPRQQISFMGYWKQGVAMPS